MNVRYAFTVKGKCPDGTRATMNGVIVAEDGYHADAFDAAVAFCRKQLPQLHVDMSTGGNVVLKKLQHHNPKLIKP